jgi:hypothetical protein
MATGMIVTKLQAKSDDKPDEVRAPSKTRVEVVRLQGFTLGRFIFQPGWFLRAQSRARGARLRFRRHGDGDVPRP